MVAAKQIITATANASFVNGEEFFSVCFGGSLRAFGCKPFRQVYSRDGADKFGVADMLPHDKLWAIAGASGGKPSRFPPSLVMLWSEAKAEFVGHLKFKAPVLSVRLCDEAVVVVMERRALVFGLSELRHRMSLDTAANPGGLCGVSDSVMVFLGKEEGEVRVVQRGTEEAKIVRAHESRIACMALTQDGRFLATASVKGTLVRIFSTADGSLLHEVRRGADRAEIQSLAFSKDGQWLAVSSDKGTVHVFGLKRLPNSDDNDDDSKSPISNSAVPSISPFSFIKGVLPKYFSSERSVAQFRLPHQTSKSVVAFGHEKDTILVLCMDGSFYRCQFDPVKGGKMTQLDHHNFLKEKESTWISEEMSPSPPVGTQQDKFRGGFCNEEVEQNIESWETL